MTVIHKNEGAKIPYETTSKSICFDDDLTINLSKREQDWPVHIDICFDEDGELVIGAAAGRAYVAEVDIPAREYIETDNPEAVSEQSEDDGGMGNMIPDKLREPVPFDIDRCTLSLWAID